MEKALLKSAFNDQTRPNQLSYIFLKYGTIFRFHDSRKTIFAEV